MSTAQLPAVDIDGVIMVGGPTRLPIVRNAVRHFFQREPNVNIDPDLVVAMERRFKRMLYLIVRPRRFY